MKDNVREALERLENAQKDGLLGMSVGTATHGADGRALNIIRMALEEGARLDALVNNPETQSFLKGVQLEAAHQVAKWGEAHDRGKSAENWFWLVGYLAGKCLRAIIERNSEKALHHTISTAAACANWHRAIKADTTGAGIGDDRDMIEIARFIGIDAEAAESRASDAEHVHYLGGSGHGAAIRIP